MTFKSYLLSTALPMLMPAKQMAELAAQLDVIRRVWDRANGLR
jgi:hypothetical protein